MNDYESFKKAYSQGTDAQKESRERRFGQDENFKNFKAQWEQEQNPHPQSSNPDPVQNHLQNQTFDSGSTYNNQVQNNQNNDQRQPSYDPNEVLDQSRFTNPNAQVRVQEGRARQTGQPDYEDDSDARMNEITNNLNAYWNTNREYFSDRATFNRIFSYDKRSKAQQAHFDGFWKRKEVEQKVGGYSDGKAVSMALEEGTLTKSQLEALKVQNPKVYNEYLQDQLKKKQLDLVNTDSPSRIFNEDEQISHNTNALTDMMKKFWFDISADGRAKDLYAKFRELKSDPKIDLMKQDYLEARRIYLQRRREFNQIPDKIRAQSSWASDGLIEARINKAQRLAYWELQSLADEAQIRKEEYVLEYGEMNDEFKAFKDQADEENRAFTRKMDALWFAKGLLSFETPEQQRQAQIRQLKEQNKLNLDYQEQQILQKNKLQSQLSDLSVKDPEQLRANLNNALNSYYEKYGSLIMRSQGQVVDDILRYAKEKKVSVAQAMSENFIKPLQWKAEYKAMINKNMGIFVGQKILNVWGKPYIQTTNADGTVSIAPYGENTVNSNTSWDYVNVPRNVNGYKNNVGVDTNNPGNITNISGTAGRYKSPNGRIYAVYTTIEEGYQALINDLKGKQAGNTRSGLNANSTIEQLLGVWVNGRGTVDKNNGYYKTFLAETKLSAGTKIGDVATETLARGIMAGEGTLQAYKKWGIDLSYLRKQMGSTTELNVDEIINFNDKSSNRKLSNTDKKRIGDLKNQVMSDPNADIEKILAYSQGGDKLTDTSTQSLVKYGQVLNQIGVLQGLLKWEDTGPILGILRSKNPYDQKARQIQVAIDAMVPTLARWVYGEVGVLTDSDIAHYTKTVPNLKTPESINTAILSMTLNMLAQGYKNQLRTLAAAGKDVSGFGGTYKNIMDEVKSLQISSLSGEPSSISKKHRWENNVLKTAWGSVDEWWFTY